MKLRENEFHWLSNSNKTRSLGTILYWMTPVLVSSITFAAYVLLGHRLSPAVVFTCLAAFRIIQDPVRVVPELMAIIIQVCLIIMLWIKSFCLFQSLFSTFLLSRILQFFRWPSLFNHICMSFLKQGMISVTTGRPPPWRRFSLWSLSKSFWINLILI